MKLNVLFGVNKFIKVHVYIHRICAISFWIEMGLNWDFKCVQCVVTLVKTICPDSCQEKRRFISRTWCLLLVWS